MTDTCRIGLVAPARWIERDVAERFAALMAEAGADVTMPGAVFARAGQLAGDDAARAAAFNAALADPDIDILWAVRGGYGALRMMGRIDWEAISYPKLLCGYSDITAIMLGTNPRNVTFVHAPMPVDIDRPGGPARLRAALDEVRALRDGGTLTPVPDLAPLQPGTATAPLAVANLAVLNTLLGTPYEPRWPGGVILCLEDVGEWLYALDRHLAHLALSRPGAKVRGLVLGDFTDLEDNEIPWGEDVTQMAQRHFPRVPIATDLPIGHGTRNIAMVQGGLATLSVGAGRATLEIAREGASS